jgi:hypothetical protein
MRAVAGIWNTGMISKMLQKKTKKKNESRSGVYLRPSGPIVSITMPSSTNSTATSARFCAPVGTSCFLFPRMKISIVNRAAKP